MYRKLPTQNKTQETSKSTITTNLKPFPSRLSIIQSFPMSLSNLCLSLLLSCYKKNLKLGDTVLTCFTSCLKLNHQKTHRECVCVWCNFHHKQQRKRAFYYVPIFKVSQIYVNCDHISSGRRVLKVCYGIIFLLENHSSDSQYLAHDHKNNLQSWSRLQVHNYRLANKSSPLNQKHLLFMIPLLFPDYRFSWQETKMSIFF